MFNKSNKFFYGVDLQKSPYFIANIYENKFDYCHDLKKLSALTGQIIIALPDSQVFNHRLSSAAFTVFTKKLSPYPLKIKAIDTQFEAIKRALYYFQKINTPCFGILNIHPEKLAIAVFLNQKKIFFHEEKVNNANQLAIFNRFLKLFSLQYPDINIKTIKFCVLNPDNAACLIACGLSLWQENTDQNFLPVDYYSPVYEKKFFRQKIFKTALYSLMLVIFLHLISCSLLNFYTHKLKALQDKVKIIQPDIQQLDQINHKNKLITLQLSALKSIKYQHEYIINFLSQLNSLMPEGIFLNTLHYQASKIFLTGAAQTKTQITVFLNSLLKNKFFVHPCLKNLQRNNTDPFYPFNFTIETHTQTLKSNSTVSSSPIETVL